MDRQGKKANLFLFSIMRFLVVVSVLGANKVHLVDGTALGATVVLVGLVEGDPDGVVRLGRVALKWEARVC